MGASYPIIHSSFRCRRSDPDAHQCLLVVGWHRATARTADLRRHPPGGIPKSSIQLTGFAIEVDSSPIWNWPSTLGHSRPRSVRQSGFAVDNVAVVLGSMGAGGVGGSLSYQEVANFSVSVATEPFFAVDLLDNKSL